MRRLTATLQATLVLAGLLLLAMPAGLACCAGIVDVHGGDCCESAIADAMARECCEGGETAIGERPEHRGAPPVLAISPLPAALRSSAGLRVADVTASAQFPPDGGLFRLHSALLL